MDNNLDLSKFKTSSVGTHVESPDQELEIHYKYSSIGWFFITFFGTSWIPRSVSFTCLKTGEQFETLLDKELIKYYMLYCKK